MRWAPKELHFMAIAEVNRWIEASKNPDNKFDIQAEKDKCPITNFKYCGGNKK